MRRGMGLDGITNFKPAMIWVLIDDDHHAGHRSRYRQASRRHGSCATAGSNRMRCKQSKESGFTLIELVSVLVILGIVDRLVPKFINLTDEARQIQTDSIAKSIESASSLNHAVDIAVGAGSSTVIAVDNCDDGGSFLRMDCKWLPLPQRRLTKYRCSVPSRSGTDRTRARRNSDLPHHWCSALGNLRERARLHTRRSPGPISPSLWRPAETYSRLVETGR